MLSKLGFVGIEAINFFVFPEFFSFFVVEFSVLPLKSYSAELQVGFCDSRFIFLAPVFILIVLDLSEKILVIVEAIVFGNFNVDIHTLYFIHKI